MVVTTDNGSVECREAEVRVFDVHGRLGSEGGSTASKATADAVGC